MNTLIYKARMAGALTARAVKTALRWTVRRLAAVWQAHRRQMESNAAYAAAMAAGAASLVGQLSWERLLVALVSAGLAIYIALRGRGLAWGQRLGGFGDRADWDDDEERHGIRLFRTPRWSES